MARRRRLIVVGAAHHITQRGNNQQPIFFDDWCRRRFLDLLDEHTRAAAVQVLGYCLMSNHTHLIVVPTKEDSLERCMQRIESEYASCINRTRERHGHLWEGRYRSFVMEDGHLWAALRYVELNPVRAGMVGRAADWDWSSARDHLDMSGMMPIEMDPWRERWGVAAWTDFLNEPTRYEEIRQIRRCTATSRPMGGEGFVKYVEEVTGVRLIGRKPGRPKAVLS